MLGRDLHRRLVALEVTFVGSTFLLRAVLSLLCRRCCLDEGSPSNRAEHCTVSVLVCQGNPVVEGSAQAGSWAAPMPQRIPGAVLLS